MIFNFILKGEIMSVKNRLIALSLVFILSLLTISTVSYFNTKSSSDDLTNISDERIPVLLTIAELDTLRFKLRSITFEVFSVYKDADYIKRLQNILKVAGTLPINCHHSILLLIIIGKFEMIFY